MLPHRSPRRRRGSVAKLDEITDRLLVVPTLVYTEVALGLDPNSSGGKQFHEIMDEVTLVAYDAQAARRAVDIQQGLQQEGAAIGAVDAMIAWTALARDEPIVTRNTSEFSRTPVRVSPY